MKLFLRAVALVLCLALCLGLCGCMPGAFELLYAPEHETEQEELLPSFAPDGPVNYAELQPQPFDSKAFLDRLEAAMAMLETDSGGEAVVAEYYALADLLTECMTSYTLYDIASYTDVTDDSLQEKSAEAYEKAVECSDAFSVFLGDLLDSRYRKDYIAAVGEENALLYENYEAMTDEQKDLVEKEKELQDEYRQLMAVEHETYEAAAAAVAPLYVELVELRRKIAESYGYEDYVTFAYEASYYRSYTPEEAAQMSELVKEKLTPLFLQTMQSESEKDRKAFFRVSDTEEETLLALLEHYIPLMSSTLDRSLQYMLDTHGYNIAYSEKKHDVSFTTVLYRYGVPFVFSQPVPDSQPLSLGSLVHEFGHYHSFLVDPTYDTPDGYVYAMDDIDVAEISSTALELLFLEFYPELYGKDAAVLQRGSLSDVLSNVVFGCVMDEFQQKIYTTENLAPEDVSEIFHGVMTDYTGDVFVDDYAYHMWAMVNHNFEAPLYYISYAMSALAAFQFWMDAQTDYDGTLQAYLELVSYGSNVDFLGLLKECGLRNVMQKRYLDDLYDALEAELLQE